MNAPSAPDKPLLPLPADGLRPFLEGIQSDPDDELAIRALGDWLEEMDDPRAELVRAGLVGHLSAVERWRARYGERWWGALADGVRLEVRRGLLELVCPTPLLTQGGVAPFAVPLRELIEQGWVYRVVLDGDTSRPLADWAADLLEHVTALRWPQCRDLSAFPRPLERLRELDLSKSGFGFMADSGLRALFPGLWRLHLRGCPRLNEVELGDWAELRALHLSWCPILTRLLLRKLPRLEALTLGMCDRLDGPWLSDLPVLRRLSLCNSPSLTDAGLARLSLLNSLHELDLSGCRLIRGTGLGCVRGMQELRRLDLSNCLALTELNLAALPVLEALELTGSPLRVLNLRHLPLLTRLDLRSSRLPDRTIQSLRQELPGCRIGG